MNNNSSWQKIGVAVSAAALLWMIWVWFDSRGMGDAVTLLIENSEGQPQTDVVIVGPKGRCITPERHGDRRGMALLPRAWVGKTLYLRDGSGRRITSFQVGPEGGTLTIP